MALKTRVKSRLNSATNSATGGAPSGTVRAVEIGEDGNVIDPAGVDTDYGGASDSEAGERKERKKRGPNKAKSKERDLVLVETLKGTMIIAHLGLAVALKSPEFALTEQQAEAMAKATEHVLSFYDTEVPAKTMAWVNLGMLAGGIYLEKAGQVAMRKRSDAARPVNPPVFHQPQGH